MERHLLLNKERSKTMSMMIFRMPQHQMDEMGECIEKGLHYFGRAMSMYGQMKHSAEGGEMHQRVPDMDYRMYPHMRNDYGYNNMGASYPPMAPEERRGYSYSRY